jgi:hypothetical protein
VLFSVEKVAAREETRRRLTMMLALIRRKTSTPARRSSTRSRDETYVAAFARVRRVRAWIGAAAAMVALGYAFAALLDRLMP